MKTGFVIAFLVAAQMSNLAIAGVSSKKPAKKRRGGVSIMGRDEASNSNSGKAHSSVNKQGSSNNPNAPVYRPGDVVINDGSIRGFPKGAKIPVYEEPSAKGLELMKKYAAPGKGAEAPKK